MYLLKSLEATVALIRAKRRIDPRRNRCGLTGSAGMVVLLCLNGLLARGAANEDLAVVLPQGVRVMWDLAKAQREATSTRERVCLNGLWRWQPEEAGSETAPVGSWGYFKVPGCWPGITDYMQKDSQTVHVHPAWRDRKLGEISTAWYEREFTVPTGWAGRRIAVSLETLNSLATVFVDGARAGEARFPGGEVDLSALCRPGGTYRLTVLVVAMPLKGVLLSYTDSASAREVKGSVPRRGLCGDVYLVGLPAGPRIADVKVDTSVRGTNLTVGAMLEGLAANARYTLRARVVASGGQRHEFLSPPFTTGELAPGGRIAFTELWMPAQLWDLHTPENTCELELALLEAGDRERDVHWRTRFGFREFWIEGRDFYLNGSRLFLSALPLDNAQVGAALANYAAARESLLRLQSFGINFVYTHNYDCEPGAHLSFEEILRAADDVGMLVALSQPHFSHYEWQSPDAERTNGYARHAEFYARTAGQHPSVVMYAMSHNATGYNEDMNPDMIDGIQDARDEWASRNVRLARRAEAIVRQLDPARIVYHHASGNLGPLHAINFYPNFAPIQELSDWFGHWATRGVKPAFLCEYGAPFTWDWTMYRGWYKGEREFGSARVPWEFCLAEWNAQFLGDRSFPASEAEQANLRWEARQSRAGNLWHRWDYPSDVGSTRFDERYPVFAAYLTDNWRAFRTWGVSAISPWEHGHFWKPRDGVNRARKPLPVDWDQLQQPGFSPDYLDQPYERMDLAFERSDWIVTPAAQALLRNNRPLLAYLAGKPARFTSKDHLFLPGETIEKQIVVINNSRQTATGVVRWTVDLPQTVSGSEQIVLATGQQQRVPLRLELPSSLPPGRHQINTHVRFAGGESQEDTFRFEVLTSPQPSGLDLQIALFDPVGETRRWLEGLGIRSQNVDASTDLSPYDLLIVGKAGLTVSGMAPDIGRVRAGLKVLIFEQTAAVLEKRLGFRVAEYGLRQVFPRVPDHPLLAGIDPEALRDWRGEASILTPRLKYEMRPRHGPTVLWCDIPVTRLWRCGNLGNVASVLIEKPERGDFLPVVDGGFSLQYSPLLEYREGRGLVLFCQLDVTGRSEVEPAAELITRNLLRYASSWQPTPRRQAVYAGEPRGKTHLELAGIPLAPYTDAALAKEQVLILGPGAGRELARAANSVGDWLQAGGRVLSIGLDQDDLGRLPALKAVVEPHEHISTGFAAFGSASPLAGIGPADLHNRDPRKVPLITGGVPAIGNGSLGEQPNVTYCQLSPWDFASTNQTHLKRTHRRTSFMVSRLLGNLGVGGSTPVLDRFHRGVEVGSLEPRWREGFYLDEPVEWDDPYRFFRW